MPQEQDKKRNKRETREKQERKKRGTRQEKRGTEYLPKNLGLNRWMHRHMEQGEIISIIFIPVVVMPGVLYQDRQYRASYFLDDGQVVPWPELGKVPAQGIFA